MPLPKVLLADDHAMVAQGLASLLCNDCELLATVHDGGSLLEAARALRPEIIVTDLSMPVFSGLEVLRRLGEEGNTAKVILLTMHADVQLATIALRAGAAGYVLKQSAGEELLLALHEVRSGRTFVTPLIAQNVLQVLSAPVVQSPVKLTQRQRDVMRLTAAGRSMKEIAAALGISPRTVETHKYEMMQALGLQTTADVIRYALEHGIASDERQPETERSVP